MADFVKNHALNNVWCAPEQDRQYIIKPARLTATGGVSRSVRVHWDTIPVPDEGDRARWHVYQIGQLPPQVINYFTSRSDLLNLPINYTETFNPSVVGFAAELSQILSQVSGQIEIQRWIKIGTQDTDWQPIGENSTSKNTWRPLSGICMINNLYIELFLDSGLQFPRTNSYIRYTHDNNVLLAVKIIQGYGDVVGENVLDDDYLYVRFYSNAYFGSQRWQAAFQERFDSFNSLPVLQRDVRQQEWLRSKPITIYGTHATDQNNYTGWRQQALAIESLFGNVGRGTWYENGFVINKPGGWTNDRLGKFYEFVWDASIKEKYHVNITDLPSFISTLDGSEEKFLIVRDATYTTIDFYDDVDVFLARNLTDTNYKGVLVHRIAEDTVRMVTHNAYSVNEGHLDSHVVQNPFMNALADCRLILNVRHSGFERGLVHQHNRIEELYKLPYSNIVGGMVGVNATIPEWTAAELEASAYNEIVRSYSEDITNEMIEDAYGYNALTRLFADPFQFPLIQEITRYAPIPHALNIRHPVSNLAHRTIFSYDVDGAFMKYQNNSGDYDQVPVTAIGAVQPALFEILHTHCTNSDGTRFPNYNSGTNSFTETVVATHDLKYHGFRCYVCPIVAGVPNEQWYDVTDNINNYYTYSEPGGMPTLTWNSALLSVASLYPCVKIGNQILLYDVPLNDVIYPGIIRFSVNAYVRWLGVNITRVQSVPPGVIDIFMDDECLTEGIDYYVDWPQIVVVRKPKRTPAEGLKVLARCYGFCNPDTMQHYPPREIGFVKGGLLSVDDEYDVRNDRNIRIIVAGKVKHRSQVRFAEDATGPLTTDGRPFSITDVIVPVEHFTSKTTYEYRQASLELDDTVQNYLNIHLEEETPVFPAVINQKWDVVSPFASALIHALLEGYLDNGELDTNYNNLDVAGWVAPYTYLLPFDPCQVGVNEDYVLIRPHQYDTTITLTYPQYRFIEYLNVHYLNTKLDLTPFITVGS